MIQNNEGHLSENTLLYPYATLLRTKPVNLKKEDNSLFAKEYTLNLKPCYIHKQEQSYVSGQGLALYKKKRLLLAAVTQCTSNNFISPKLFVKMLVQHALFRTNLRIPKGIVITDNNSHGYFHWLCDVLPKLVSIDKALFNEYVLLIPEKFFSRFAEDSLQILLGINVQITLIPKFSKMLVDELLILDHLATPAGTGNYRPESINLLQSQVLGQLGQLVPRDHKLSATYGNKIFISRSDAKYRYLQNEEEIIPLLKKHGFSILKASSVSFFEQVQLFSSAKIIIGMHGAGLSNMLWMQARTIVVEIRLEHDTHNNCYYSLASALNLQYYYSLATSNSKEIHKANFIWNKEHAEQLLAELKITPSDA